MSSPSNFQDLTGNRYGMLTVIERAEDYVSPTGNHLTQWKCRCDCGNITIKRSTHLKKGKATSCGCYRKKRNSEVHTKDLTGRVFGRLTVLSKVESYVSPTNHKQSMWKCKCECGNIVNVNGQSLIQGLTKSCGCLLNENYKVWKQNGMVDSYEDTRISSLNNTIPSNNSSGVKGVYFDSTRNKYVAQIGLCGKNYHLGRFNTLKQATSIRKEAEIRLWDSKIVEYAETHTKDEFDKYVKRIIDSIKNK